MTRPSQKQRERFFTEQAIRSLGVNWVILKEREPPDFDIAEGDYRFGIEVREVFIGPQSGSGAAMKKAESSTQYTINALRREYEAATSGIRLIVKFVGRITPETTASVVSTLIALDIASKPPAYQTVIDESRGLRVYVTKAFRSDWYSVDRRVGWVDRNPHKIIADAIEAKSKKLSVYQAVFGPDIRLLLVSDAVYNSGKMRLQEGQAFDFHGFNAVYFFPYPEEVIVLDKGTVA